MFVVVDLVLVGIDSGEGGLWTNSLAYYSSFSVQFLL